MGVSGGVANHWIVLPSKVCGTITYWTQLEKIFHTASEYALSTNVTAVGTCISLKSGLINPTKFLLAIPTPY